MIHSVMVRIGNTLSDLTFKGKHCIAMQCVTSLKNAN